MNFLQRTPFFRLLLSLILGIVIYQYIKIPQFVLILIGVISGFIAILSIIIRKEKIQFQFSSLFGFSLLTCLMVVGYFICQLFDYKNQFSEHNKIGTYEVELITSPIEKEKSYSFKVKLIHRFDSSKTVATNGKAILYIQKDENAAQLLIGDRIIIHSRFDQADGVQNPKGFDYATYLKRQGIGATSYISSENWFKTEQKATFSIKRIANKSRNFLLSIYKNKGIDGDEFAVLAALTLGFKDSLEPDIQQLYSHSGAAHILAVSGLHVGVVYVAILSFLGFLWKTQRQKTIKGTIAILFIWCYAILTGLSPAVLRATLMMSFVSFATIFSRNSQVINTVFLSAFILLVFNPNLLFNIGFQLSYLAVISILVFQPQLSKLYRPKNRAIKWFWDLTAVSVAAQIGTAPVTIYYFNQFPNYFLLTNYIAIPISTVIIYGAIFLLFVSFIPLISIWTGFALKWIIWLMNYLLKLIVSIPHSIAEINISTVQLFLLVGILIFFTAFISLRKYWHLMIGLSFILIFLVVQNIRIYNSFNGSQMIVFSDTRNSIINITDGKKNLVFTLDSLQAKKIAKPFWDSSLFHKPIYFTDSTKIEDRFIAFNGKKVMILDGNWLRKKTTDKTLKVDYLILTNKLKPKMEEILDCVEPKIVITDKSISQWYENHVREVCEQNEIIYYSVAEKGAFITEL